MQYWCLPAHLSFIIPLSWKKEKESGDGGGGEVVKQDRGAINLAVNVQKYALTSLLPYFAATHFHMQGDKSPDYDEKQMRHREHRQTEAGSETKCQPLQ